MLVRGDEKEQMKSQLLTVISDTLYGVYKGNVTVSSVCMY